MLTSKVELSDESGEQMLSGQTFRNGITERGTAVRLRHNYEYASNKAFNNASLQRGSGIQSCMRKINFPSS